VVGKPWVLAVAKEAARIELRLINYHAPPAYVAQGVSAGEHDSACRVRNS
jgi:hypothetical protein